MGRKPWLPLKPLPPSKDKYIFCYDGETGNKIMNFEICGNRIILKGEHKRIIVDYTFDYDDKIRELNIGNRLFNGYLNLTAKIDLKDYYSGEIKTAILEIPRIKLQTNLNLKLGDDVDNPIVSDFYFIGYPSESRLESEQDIWKITFLNERLSSGIGED